MEDGPFESSSAPTRDGIQGRPEAKARVSAVVACLKFHRDGGAAPGLPTRQMMPVLSFPILGSSCLYITLVSYEHS